MKFSSCVLAALLFSTPILSATINYPTVRPYQPPTVDHDAYAVMRSKLLLLRDEGLKLRDADGGTLTGQHRAYLQSKMEAILSQARRGG